MDEYNYTIPVWAALAMCYNADDLTTEQYDQLTAFEHSLCDDGMGTWDFGKEPEFCHANDVDSLGGDCYKAVYTPSKCELVS